MVLLILTFAMALTRVWKWKPVKTMQSYPLKVFKCLRQEITLVSCPTRVTSKVTLRHFELMVRMVKWKNDDWNFQRSQTTQSPSTYCIAFSISPIFPQFSIPSLSHSPSSSPVNFSLTNIIMITIASCYTLVFLFKKSPRNGCKNQGMQVQLQGVMLRWIAERTETRNQVLLGKKLEASQTIICCDHSGDYHYFEKDFEREGLGKEIYRNWGVKENRERHEVMNEEPSIAKHSLLPFSNIISSTCSLQLPFTFTFLLTWSLPWNWGNRT